MKEFNTKEFSLTYEAGLEFMNFFISRTYSPIKYPNFIGKKDSYGNAIIAQIDNTRYKCSILFSVAEKQSHLFEIKQGDTMIECEGWEPNQNPKIIIMSISNSHPWYKRLIAMDDESKLMILEMLSGIASGCFAMKNTTNGEIIKPDIRQKFLDKLIYQCCHTIDHKCNKLKKLW